MMVFHLDFCQRDLKRIEVLCVAKPYVEAVFIGFQKYPLKRYWLLPIWEPPSLPENVSARRKAVVVWSAFQAINH